jgi:hypothetical protein
MSNPLELFVEKYYILLLVSFKYILFKVLTK